jgi:hypothetical protein
MEWHAMLLLGAFHGINPGMGWLFAVALGMQHQSARGVWLALPAIACGHVLAVGAVVLVATAAGLVVPAFVLKAVTAAVLMAFGCYRLWRHRHPRFGGMQVGFRDLTAWSFLMASAHGAGVMVLPWVMMRPAAMAAAAGDHASHAMATGGGTPLAGVLAVSAHTLAYLVVMTLAAWVVYRKLGLAVLRTAWFNLDRVWAGALVVTGIAVLVVW